MWVENKIANIEIANIEYVKQVDIFYESNPFDICAWTFAQPPGFWPIRESVTGIC